MGLLLCCTLSRGVLISVCNFGLSRLIWLRQNGFFQIFADIVGLPSRLLLLRLTLVFRYYLVIFFGTLFVTDFDTDLEFSIFLKKFYTR